MSGIGAVQELLLTTIVVEVVAFVAVTLVCVGLGLWLGVATLRSRGTIPDGESGIGYLRAAIRRNRKARREKLTVGERIFAWTMVVLSGVLAPAGVIILLTGDSGLRPVGIALLILALLVFATPISPILQARVRRRERANGE